MFQDSYPRQSGEKSDFPLELSKTNGLQCLVYCKSFCKRDMRVTANPLSPVKKPMQNCSSHRTDKFMIVNGRLRWKVTKLTSLSYFHLSISFNAVLYFYAITFQWEMLYFVPLYIFSQVLLLVNFHI